MAGEERARLEQVLALVDVGVRNYAITRTYHRMARRLDGVVGEQDANWLTFGTWASASAGRVIRGEAVPGGWGAAAVAAGNAAIIADIGPRFAAFLDLAETVPTGELAAALASQPELAVTPELEEAFAGYAAAAQLRDVPGADADAEHAELVLRANTLVAHHEQRLADSLVDEAIPLGGPFGSVATSFVTVELPDRVLHVARDVGPPAYLAGRMWPEVLERLRDERLVALARQYDQDLASARRSNATSWESFHERMGYIFCFFRAYQRDPQLRALPPGVPPSATP